MAPPLQPGDEVHEGALFRRVPNTEAQWSSQLKRPTSNNFVPAKTQDHLSMQLASLIGPDEILATYPTLGLLEIAVEAFVVEGFTVRYMPEGGEAGHVGVFGIKNAPKSVLKRLVGRILRFWSPEDHTLHYPPIT